MYYQVLSEISDSLGVIAGASIAIAGLCIVAFVVCAAVWFLRNT